MQSDSTTSATSSLKRRIEVSEIAMVFLLLLSAMGIGVTDWQPEWGFNYWLSMAPIFGVTCLATGWSAARSQGQSPSRVIVSQVLHWLGLAAALWIMFLFSMETGRINNADMGLVSLVLLALATFLVGVHVDWRFCIVGVVLGCTALLVAVVEQFLWLGLVPVFIGLGVYGYWRLRR